MSRRGWLRAFGALGALIVLQLASGSAHAGTVDEKSARFDAQIEQELRAQDADAADLFVAANRAREAGDQAEASRLYGESAGRAPTFSHAVRRQGTAELALGHRGRGLVLIRRALEMDPSPPNYGALAIGLASHTNGVGPSDIEAVEAETVARRAIDLDPDYYYAHLGLALAAVARNSAPGLAEAVRGLLRTGPDEVGAHYFAAVSALSEGDPDRAREEVEQARALGLSPETADELLAAIENSPLPLERFGPVAAVAAGAWLAVLGLLFLVGTALSRSTLAATERFADTPGAVESLSGRLRSFYRGVIGASTTYFWISVPLLLVLILGGGALAVLGLMSLERIPLKLLVVVGLVTVVSAVAVVRSLWTALRREYGDPGVALEIDRHPALRSVLHEVAAKIGTRPVDTLFVTPATDFAVIERGGVLERLRDRGERCLILGIGVLEGMDQTAFRSVLAHEYGHFSNRDTAGGGYALTARVSLLEMIRHMIQGGVARWYNPAWWFVRGFYAVFLRITQGASRLQEYLADRWAATCYGAAAFERGLRHVIAQSIRFDHRTQACLKEVIEQRRPLANLYEYQPASRPSDEDLAKETQAALEAEPSAYDSHPTPMRRFAWARWVAGSASPSSVEDDLRPAWELFADRAALERQMTEQVRASVQAHHGVEIAAPA